MKHWKSCCRCGIDVTYFIVTHRLRRTIFFVEKSHAFADRTILMIVYPSSVTVKALTSHVLLLAGTVYLNLVRPSDRGCLQGCPWSTLFLIRRGRDNVEAFRASYRSRRLTVPVTQIAANNDRAGNYSDNRHYDCCKVKTCIARISKPLERTESLPLGLSRFTQLSSLRFASLM